MNKVEKMSSEERAASLAWLRMWHIKEQLNNCSESWSAGFIGGLKYSVYITEEEEMELISFVACKKS